MPIGKDVTKWAIPSYEEFMAADLAICFHKFSYRMIQGMLLLCDAQPYLRPALRALWWLPDTMLEQVRWQWGWFIGGKGGYWGVEQGRQGVYQGWEGVNLSGTSPCQSLSSFS